MGSVFSKKEQSPVAEKPWRDINWTKEGEVRINLKFLMIKNPDVAYLRILLYGPVGSGKSSFINSVSTAIKERACIPAGAASGTDKSYSTKFLTHYIENDKERRNLAFTFHDTMGLEFSHRGGIDPKDIILALGGHIPEDYEFVPASPLQPEQPPYKSNPALSDKAHCVVCVIDMNSLMLLSDDIVAKIKRVKSAANDLEIPQYVVLTKVDKSCKIVENDLKKIYHSKAINEKVERCCHILGFPKNTILLVKNYWEETHSDRDADVLLLNATKLIADAANDYASAMQHKQSHR